jgi:hypothetical protein
MEIVALDSSVDGEILYINCLALLDSWQALRKCYYYVRNIYSLFSVGGAWVWDACDKPLDTWLEQTFNASPFLRMSI